MKVLVIGSGGREHALVWKIQQSPLVDKIYCAPGNPGIAQHAECVDIQPTDIPRLLEFAVNEKIDLTVPGPEAPLVQGLVDEFEAKGLTIFGPSQKAAELEGSKAFAKWLMRKYNVPTAEWQVFYDAEEARRHLREREYPCVIKADGLAAGKGAVIVQDEQQAEHALDEIMVRRVFGEAGAKIVVEDYMRGEEASVFALSDGENVALLHPAQDHKPIFDGDQGPNTGGMGAYAPAPVVDTAMQERVLREIIEPTIRGMAMENRPYRGVLYAGLMITEDGPKVVEFNCRFGDPEAQVVLPLLGSDLVDLMMKAAHREMHDAQIELLEQWAVCVVMASGGYPGTYETGKKIIGLEKLVGEDILIFHAGTRRNEGGAIVTAGGRVLSVVAVRDTFHAAREAAYAAVGKIAFDGAYYRKDIGYKALKHLAGTNS
ncbi:MAG: phosphoribosylamine--glycine ligase [candidate division KSB1 bacterium]|nr:phosphoribosylamine--glycine ligase [candidate division KSB1 bacterium]